MPWLCGCQSGVVVELAQSHAGRCGDWLARLSVEAMDGGVWLALALFHIAV